MGRGPHANDGFTRLQIVVDMLHLIIRWAPETGGNNHEIRIIQRGQVGDIRLVIRIHDTWFLRILRKQNGAFETVVSAQNLSQLRHRFLRTVFLVPRD